MTKKTNIGRLNDEITIFIESDGGQWENTKNIETKQSNKTTIPFQMRKKKETNKNKELRQT